MVSNNFIGAQVAASLQNVRSSCCSGNTLSSLDKLDFSSLEVDPSVSDEEERRKKICGWCVDTIHRHLCLMNSVCKGVITENKLQSTTVGLLYLMRNGIVVHELVVLPRLQVGIVPILSSLCFF